MLPDHVGGLGSRQLFRDGETGAVGFQRAFEVPQLDPEVADLFMRHRQVPLPPPIARLRLSEPLHRSADLPDTKGVRPPDCPGRSARLLSICKARTDSAATAYCLGRLLSGGR